MLWKWLTGIGIGGLFGWLTLRDGVFELLLTGPVVFVDGYLLKGRMEPLVLTDATGSTAPTGTGWQIPLSGIAIYLLCLSIIHFLRAYRWQPLIRGFVNSPIASNRLNAISAVGFMAMFLLPFRLGELVRPILAQRETGNTPTSSLLASVVLERVADGLIVTLLLGLSLLFTEPEIGRQEALLTGGIAASIVFTAALIILVGMALAQKQTEAVLRLMMTPVPRSLSEKIMGILLEFMRGLRSVPDWTSLVQFIGLSLIYWVFNAFAIWFIAPGFAVPVSFSMAVIMMACVVVGMMIPNSPGNIGTFWYFLLLPFAAIPALYTSEQLLVFGVMLYVCQLTQQTGFGAFFLIRGDFTFHDALGMSRPSES